MHDLSRRIALTLFGLLVTAAWQATAAQDSDTLSAPGNVRADTAYGHVGDWFALRSLEGEPIPFQDLGDRVLFVNFWATWCRPCIEEMPTITGLADTLGESDVAFLLISIDENERDVRRFVKKRRLSLPVYFQDWPPGASTFAAGIVPATFIVSREKKIVYQHHGAANWNIEPIRRLLRELAHR